MEVEDDLDAALVVVGVDEVVLTTVLPFFQGGCPAEHASPLQNNAAMQQCFGSQKRSHSDSPHT